MRLAGPSLHYITVNDSIFLGVQFASLHRAGTGHLLRCHQELMCIKGSKQWAKVMCFLSNHYVHENIDHELKIFH